jgi:hypothetical protein
MDDYQRQIIKLADQLTEKEVGEPRSVIGIISLVHNLVEETIRRVKTKKKLPEAFKKELSVRVLKNVVEILNEKNLINNILFETIIDNLNQGNLSLFLELIEDVIEIYNSQIVQSCLCGKKNKRNNLKKLKTL